MIPVRRFLRSVRDALLPRSGWRPKDDPVRDAECKADIDAINAANWALNTEFALAEAERIYAAEAERRKSAETKATTYLVLATAFTPILVSIQTALWEKKAGPAPIGLSLFLTFVALLYLFIAGVYLFRAIAASQSFRVDTPDILHFWTGRDRRQALVREKLGAARLTQDEVNRKISYVRAAQGNLYNATMALALLLAINSIWYFSDTAANRFQGWWQCSEGSQRNVVTETGAGNGPALQPSNQTAPHQQNNVTSKIGREDPPARHESH